MAITTSKGSYQDYAYTGGMQSVTIPHDGIYKFEVWGAGGSNSALHGGGAYGNNYNTNGKGGYSVGYKLCKKGEVYYICVGGCNVPYNGGGVGDAGWGGGATHIATKTGELKNLSGNKAAVLLVAGGGGGTGQANGEGGVGGGWYGGGYGGTQTGSGSGGSDKGSFGQGGQGDWYWADGGLETGAGGGGGGGWYGGNGGNRYMGGGAGGGGGSGYIGGLPSFTSAGGTVYSPSTTAGGGNAVNADGSARVTFLRKNDVPVIFNGEQVEDVVLNGVKLTGMMVDGIRLYMKKRREKRCFA